MKVKRFFAPDMANAMRLVRDEVGPDAVIISNNRVAGGVEVVVALDYEHQPRSLGELERRQRKERQLNVLTGKRAAPAGQRSSARSLQKELNKTQSYLAKEQSHRPDNDPPLLRAVKDRQLSLDEQSLDQVLAALERKKSAAGRGKAPTLAALEQRGEVRSNDLEVAPPVSPRQSTPTRQEGASNSAVIQAMQEEIASLKQLLSQQIQASSAAQANSSAQPGPAEAAPSPVRSGLEKRLEYLGLSRRLVGRLLQALESGQPLDQAWKHALARLADALPTVGEDLVERGGLIAFLGPTGVGKTTTIGKLAARYVLNHGSSGIALVTTDSYRIAAHEQLRTFGRILDIPVRVVDENRSLEEALHGLRDKRVVLIDTAGMGGGSQQTQEQVAMLENCSYRIKKLLVMSAASQHGVMDTCFQQFKSLGLNGCVLSKLDEAASLGEALSVVVEGRLPVAYVTDGQRIPDHIELAQARSLVSRSVVLAQEQQQRRAEFASVNKSTVQDGARREPEAGWAS